MVDNLLNKVVQVLSTKYLQQMLSHLYNELMSNMSKCTERKEYRDRKIEEGGGGGGSSPSRLRINFFMGPLHGLVELKFSEDFL